MGSTAKKLNLNLEDALEDARRRRHARAGTKHGTKVVKKSACGFILLQVRYLATTLLCTYYYCLRSSLRPLRLGRAGSNGWRP